MKSVEDDQITQLESYVLSPNKQAYIAGLVSENKLGSIIQIVHELNSGRPLSPECTEAIEKLKGGLPYVDPTMKPVLLRQLIKEVEREQSKQNVVRLIEMLDQMTVNIKGQLLVHTKPNATVTSEGFRDDKQLRLPTLMDDRWLDLASEVTRIEEDPRKLQTRTYQPYIYFHLDLEKIVEWGIENKANEAINWILDGVENFSNLKVLYSCLPLESNSCAEDLFQSQAERKQILRPPKETIQEDERSAAKAAEEEHIGCGQSVGVLDDTLAQELHTRGRRAEGGAGP